MSEKKTRLQLETRFRGQNYLDLVWGGVKESSKGVKEPPSVRKSFYLFSHCTTPTVLFVAHASRGDDISLERRRFCFDVLRTIDG